MDEESSTTTPLLRHRHQWWRKIPSNAASTLRLHNTTLWSELGGSVGDLGTYIPIVLALTLVSNLDLGTTLIFTAFYNIATGLLFGIPMPVQPMQAIAAVAVTEQPLLTLSQIAAAGICTSSVLLILGVTGIWSLIYRIIPLPVIRGVQLYQGLALALKAVNYVMYDQNFAAKQQGDDRSWLGLDGIIVAFSAIAFITFTTGSGETYEKTEPGVGKRQVPRKLQILSSIPAALIIFLIGIILCFIIDPSIISHLQFGPSKFQVLKITWDDIKIGFSRGAVPEIPVSIFNSVFAVCKLSGDLFPEQEASVTAVSVSVGLMNMVGCWFGAMPVCHGAGGLAGQYRFGGRTGASVVLLGVAKLVVGLVFGNSFIRIMSQFPVAILGALLLFAGIELAMATKDMNSREDSFLMLVCAAISLAGSSAALGVNCVMLMFLLMKIREGFFGSPVDVVVVDE